MSVSIEFLKHKYDQIVKAREILWDDLRQIPEDRDWLIKRLSKHQWSIDEVLRHMYASEVRYVQQPIKVDIPQPQGAVPAQWVGKIFFRFEENEHMDLDNLITTFDETQKNTRKIMEKWDDEMLNKMVEAPWRELFPYRNSVIHFMEHEMEHMGQVRFMLTYWRGPPEFASNWFDVQDQSE